MPATTEVDGRTVTYREAGDGPGAPLLLVHGFTGSKEDYDPVVGPLAEERRVVAVDLPGHGGSEGSDDPAAYGLAAMASWLLRFADALGMDELHLLGHSMGGLIVQRTAALASQRLQSLLLMATGLGALREEAGDHVVRMAVAARDHGMEACLAEVLKRPPPEFVAPANPQRDAFVARRFLNQNTAAVVGGARNLIGAAPLGAFLYGIDIPVLVISGQHDDAWTPSEQALLARTVAGARHVVVPDAAHSPQLDNPDYWLKAVSDFLADAERLTAG
jgi:pimeloyl-ACP methyl ester carboxylesterase